MDGAGDREEEILFTNGVRLAAGVGRVSIDQHVDSVRSEPLIDPIDPDAGKAYQTCGRWRLMKFGAQHPAAEDYRCVADKLASGSVSQRAAAARREKRWEWDQQQKEKTHLEVDARRKTQVPQWFWVPAGRRERTSFVGSQGQGPRTLMRS